MHLNSLSFITFQPHIDFQNSKRFRGQQLDIHKLTHKQKVQFGIESENVSK